MRSHDNSSCKGEGVRGAVEMIALHAAGRSTNDVGAAQFSSPLYTHTTAGALNTSERKWLLPAGKTCDYI